jgi:hypothetical protein
VFKQLGISRIVLSSMELVHTHIFNVRINNSVTMFDFYFVSFNYYYYVICASACIGSSFT